MWNCLTCCVVDVEKFYQLCDPGELSCSSLGFVVVRLGISLILLGNAFLLFFFQFCEVQFDD